MEALLTCCTKELGDFLKIQIKERLQAMISLQDSASKLVKEMDQLRFYRNDKENKVRAEEGKDFRFKRTEVVKGWLKSVDELRDRVNKFDDYLNGPRVSGGEASSSRNEASTYQAGDQGGCSCGLCEKIKSCCCSCCCALCNLLKRWGSRLCVLVKLSGEVAVLIGEVRDLRRQGDEINELVIEVEGENETYGADMVGNGASDALSRIREYLTGDKVGIVGIYGMGGVGKSSLLRTIQHEYTHERKSEFQPVILAEVTGFVDMDKLLEDPGKNVVDIERLRNSIGSKLPSASSSSGWNAESLKEALRNSSRFLLLLENVWEELELEKIGIPTPDPHNRFKIVFTTRSNAVCNDMNAKGVKLNRLTEVEGFELFRRQLSNNHLLSRYDDHAKMIVKECHGLPLALEVMARVMRNKNFKQDWLDTVKALQDPRTMFDDGVMGKEKVFKILMYSYCHLQLEWRPCLLYCSLFDNSMDIDIEELIEYWIGEGFFDRNGGVPDISTVRRKGREVVNQLVSACLLECSSNEEDKAKMHGLIRDMAIKIAVNEFLVYPDSMTKSEEKGTNWEQAKRISLMGSNVSKLPTKNCSKLETLLLKNCEGLKEIPEDFFSQMSALRVLDLSKTRIEVLPRTIINLKRLRLLNLSYTKIRSLPKETKEMENLVQLNLSFTLHLETVPYEAILGLSNLRTLNLLKSRYRNWEWDASDPERGVSLSDLELLKLEEFGLNINEHRVLDGLLDSRLAESTVCLYLEGFEGITPEAKFDALEKLRELYIANFLQLQKLVFKHCWLLNLEMLELSSLSIAEVSICEKEQNVNVRRLSRVEISKCNNLEHLSWVRHLGCLETLTVSCCSRLRAVVTSDGGHGEDKLCFNSLRAITLIGLPNLESFCEWRMEMSAVPSLTIDECPKLTGEFVYYDKEGNHNKISYQDCQKQVTRA